MKLKTKFVEKRVIHLDLKGMPPLPQRLIRLPEIFSAAGYNAILVEFEDMFPWTVDKRFRSANCYSVSDLREFADACKKSSLEIIPLVQTLGHMETFLRPDTYASMREIPSRHDAINCLSDGAQDFLISLFQDVLKVFPDVECFHIGGDEAWTFGSHPQTSRYIEKNGKVSLLLKHIRPLANYLTSRGIRTLLWHDMFIDYDQSESMSFDFPFELIIWGYDNDFNKPGSLYSTEAMKKLCDLNLPLWGASAFKGADGAFSNLPNIKKRCENTLSWLQINEQFELRGIIATGWSRYTTYCVQVEPIEVALDSMICVGHMLKTGKMPEDNSVLCKNVLSGLGEFESFQNCYASMRKYSDIQQSIWNHIREMTEQLAIESIRKECCCSEFYEKVLRGKNEPFLDKFIIAQEDAYEKLSAFFHRNNLDEYFETRFKAIKTQLEWTP